jgi:hypothetical protein
MKISSKIDDRVYRQVSDQVRGQVLGQVRAQVSHQVRYQVSHQVREMKNDIFENKYIEEIKQLTSPEFRHII